jgi:hypothetical protein
MLLHKGTNFLADLYEIIIALGWMNGFSYFNVNGSGAAGTWLKKLRLMGQQFQII